MKDRLGFAALVAAGVPAAWGALELWRIVVASPRLPLWDMAKYGVSGLRLHDALAHGDVWRALLELNDMSVWPPLWPSLSALGFAFLGVDFSTPRLLLVLIWGLAVVAAAWAPRPLVGGPIIGMMAAAWLAAGPMFQGLATVNLLELPGLTLLIIALGSYLRALNTESPRWWWATAITSLCLIFCKYNYGLLWIVPLAMAEVRRRSGSWHEGLGWLIAGLKRLPWRHPLSVIAFGLGIIIVLIRITGGLELTLAGHAIRLTSVGNPAYLLYLLFCGWTVRAYRAGRSRSKGLLLRGEAAERFDKFRPEDRIWILGLGLPVALWLFIPPHLKELFNFLGNRSSELSWGEGLVFYPEVMLRAYAPHPVLAIAVLILSAFSIRDLWGTSDSRRIVALSLWLAVVALLLHPYKLERFAFQAAWLSGLAGAVCGVHLASARLGKFGESIGWILGFCGLGLATWSGIDQEHVAQRHRLWTVSESVGKMLEDLIAPERQREGGVLVLGAWNGLSPALIEMADRIEHGHRSVARSSDRPLLTTGISVARRRSERLLKVLEAEDFRWIAVVSAEPGSAFDRETAWLDPARDWLERSGLYAPIRAEERAGSYRWQWYSTEIGSRESELPNLF